jgi:hypothetical protein
VRGLPVPQCHDATTGGGRLPVMVWIPGGGFVRTVKDSLQKVMVCGLPQHL